MNAYERAQEILAEAGSSEWTMEDYRTLASFILHRPGVNPYRRRKRMVNILALALKQIEHERELNEPRLVFDIGTRLVSLGNWYHKERDDSGTCT